MFEVQMHIRK